MPHRGKLTIIYGPMYSGKTTQLIELMSRESAHMLAFKPALDNRYGEGAMLTTHDGKEAPVMLVNEHKPKEIVDAVKDVPDTTMVLIDEINFFSLELVHVIQEILAGGCDVVAAGLLLDSERGDFGPTRDLVAIADEVNSVCARCDYEGCGTPAEYSYAKAIKRTQVQVGAFDLYGVACGAHYSLLHVPGVSESVLPVTKKLVDRLVDLGVYPSYAEWLRTIGMPYKRVRMERNNRKWPMVEIGGDSMRCGKSTALAVLAKALENRGVTLMQTDEAWEANPYLELSYSDPSKNLLESQKWFAERKFGQLLERDKNVAHINCVHPEMDYCYALTNTLLGRMSLKQFDEYTHFYDDLGWENIPAPDLLIYLTSSDDVLVRRVHESARAFETIADNYILAMKLVNQLWMSNVAESEIRLLMVNTDTLDYAHSDDDAQSFVSMVTKALHDDGWEIAN